jgi:hypothetical protein
MEIKGFVVVLCVVNLRKMEIKDPIKIQVKGEKILNRTDVQPPSYPGKFIHLNIYVSYIYERGR